MSIQIESPVSSTSTDCSTPLPVDIKSMLVLEKKRFEGKGYGTLVAWAMTITFFYYAPTFSRTVWPYFLNNFEEGKWVKWQYSMWLLANCSAIAYGVIFAVWIIIYRYEFPFLEQYKINDTPWPWKEDREKWNQTLKRTVKILGFNLGVSHSIALVLINYLNNYIPDASYALEDIPDSFTMLLQFVFFCVAEDFTFHILHRLLHWKKIYPYIHKIHHEYINPIGPACFYAHPLEYIFVDAFASYVGIWLLGSSVHIMTVLLWGPIRLVETFDGHSGYEFSWSPYKLLPFGTPGSYHNFHHTHNIGNYSSFFTFWDTVFGVNKEYFAYQQKLSQANHPRNTTFTQQCAEKVQTLKKVN